MVGDPPGGLHRATGKKTALSVRDPWAERNLNFCPSDGPTSPWERFKCPMHQHRNDGNVRHHRQRPHTPLHFAQGSRPLSLPFREEGHGVPIPQTVGRRAQGP